MYFIISTSVLIMIKIVTMQPDRARVEEMELAAKGKTTNIGMKFQSAKNIAKIGSRLLQQRSVSTYDEEIIRLHEIY